MSAQPDLGPGEMTGQGEELPNGHHESVEDPGLHEEELVEAVNGATLEDAEQKKDGDNRVLEYLEEAMVEAKEATSDGPSFRKFRTPSEPEEPELEPPSEQLDDRPPSSTGSYSNPDDTPSLPGSATSSSLAGSTVTGSRFSPSPSLRPFDRRFQSRIQPISPSLSPSPRAISPSLLSPHSRNASISSRINDIGALDNDSSPWDVVRWTKLKKITSQLYSEAGRRSFGSATCLVVSATIAIGTDKGLILVFDYSQTFKAIIGSGTKAIECGAVTALAVSADHSMIAGGHANGHIFTWEIAKPARPFMQIPPLHSYELENRKHDGHVSGVSVLHLDFLGTRRTALASADDRGMAFSHLATRGLGAVGRIVKTTRILGRYPTDISQSGRLRKPSTVLGFSVLPLGNSAERTDSMGIVAMLTPYLLVIVSTTPIAQTQYKVARSKEVASDTALTGCLAWYPAVSKAPASKARLVYAWSNILTLLELSVVDKGELEDVQKPPTLEFRPRSRFRCDEAIVAVQWMSRQVVAVLTVSQRLIILEDTSLRVTETFDLMSRQVLHRGVFARQLRAIVSLADEDGSGNQTVADAFYHSFKAYKGRLFVLGFYDVSVGTLSNWADRLLAMMEIGDYIGAINLATSYYVGDVDKLTIGLPLDPAARHEMVRERLLEMMSASLRYAFGKNQSAKQKGVASREELQQLAIACFDACNSMGSTDFLFDVSFEFYEQSSNESIFLETLEQHILERRISIIPPTIVKALIKHYTSLELDSRLEEMICQLDTQTLDIDQITRLCKEHRLYDAMIYVWNRALNDYITPTIDLLRLLLPLIEHGNLENSDTANATDALKLFPYLAYTWTGRVYPTGEELPEPEASQAKAQLYYILFLGRTITWPKNSGRVFLTSSSSEVEPSFPYLRLILQFDAASFLSAMNEAFEDPFLNGVVDGLINGKQDVGEELVFGSSVNRQYVVSILLEVMNSSDFPVQDTIYLDMFIARNLPKYPQFILLSGSALHKVLVGLCNPPGPDIADDCQLSVEYLLTVYRPPDLEDLIVHFTKAGYFRVLKSIFRSEKKHAKLLQAYFDDIDAKEAVFDCITECLRPKSGLSEKQVKEVKAVLEKNARALINIDGIRAARTIDTYAPDLHPAILQTMQDLPEHQYLYLKNILEPGTEGQRYDALRGAKKQNRDFVEVYIRLMCDFDPEHVADYVRGLQSGDLRLEQVIPAMESTGVMDAAVVLMAREGQIRQAMDRLIAHFATLENSFLGIINASEKVTGIEKSNDAAKEILQSLKKYATVGVWLAQGQMKSAKPKGPLPARWRRDNDQLTKDEILWLDVIDTVVRVAKDGINAVTREEGGRPCPVDVSMVTGNLRQFVQDTFSALLAATSTSQTTSFLHILRAFLTRAALSSPSLADLRNVLADIFEAYMYEEKLLSLANSLIDRDLFVHVHEAAELRQRGWRASSQTCEICGKRSWGPGAASGIYSAWEQKRLEATKRLELRREEQRVQADETISAIARGKGKAKVIAPPLVQPETNSEPENHRGAVVVFSCGHLYHKKCFETVHGKPDASQHVEYKCAVCTSAPVP
ncbi:hypothetical protein EX30DRAFT_340258 [Ascodesmis nigricans]|uniref:Uncharacterized protein n=1 Tax=Ascodesmis nigricans TaxID=341454 RepID=A0A4S2MYM0_9PEZI|nr:hypothetical protein EX30DRAFT_340258 [Ascodesmis nigricans]